MKVSESEMEALIKSAANKSMVLLFSALKYFGKEIVLGLGLKNSSIHWT